MCQIKKRARTACRNNNIAAFTPLEGAISLHVRVVAPSFGTHPRLKPLIVLLEVGPLLLHLVKLRLEDLKFLLKEKSTEKISCQVVYGINTAFQRFVWASPSHRFGLELVLRPVDVDERGDPDQEPPPGPVADTNELPDILLNATNGHVVGLQEVDDIQLLKASFLISATLVTAHFPQQICTKAVRICRHYLKSLEPFSRQVTSAHCLEFDHLFTQSGVALVFQMSKDA